MLIETKSAHEKCSNKIPTRNTLFNPVVSISEKLDRYEKQSNRYTRNKVNTPSF